MLSSDTNFTQAPTFPILDLHVHLLDNYTDWLVARLNQKIGTHVVTLNAEMSMMAQENAALAQAIAAADLVIPDGAGIIVYMRLRGRQHQRCPGIELAASLIEYVGKSADAHSLCFFGGSPGIAQQAALTWQQQLPNLAILTQDGYVSGEAETEWKQTLAAKQPDVILVGIGVPRQELWISENRSLCPNAIWIGVGAECFLYQNFCGALCSHKAIFCYFLY